jgi:hypothetical protein
MYTAAMRRHEHQFIASTRHRAQYIDAASRLLVVWANCECHATCLMAATAAESINRIGLKTPHTKQLLVGCSVLGLCAVGRACASARQCRVDRLVFGFVVATCGCPVHCSCLQAVSLLLPTDVPDALLFLALRAKWFLLSYSGPTPLLPLSSLRNMLAATWAPELRQTRQTPQCVRSSAATAPQPGA